MSTVGVDSNPNDVYTRVVSAFRVALKLLGASPSASVLVKLGDVVHSSMSDQGRFYHRTAHVFDLFSTPEADPIATLAALFHDTVYTQVDGGLPASVKSELDPLVLVKDGSYFVQETTNDNMEMVNVTFGFDVGHKLGIFAGLNEYLSALLAISELQSLCSREILLQIAMCIEATIPFRKPDANGKQYTDRMFDRCWNYVQQNHLQLTYDDVIKAVQRAVVLANNDVGNFSSKDSRVFLKNTWNLLPEANPTLRNAGTYTLKEYRTSLFKSTNFLKFLDPSVVFNQYKGVPTELDLGSLTIQAKLNLSLAVLYMKYKIVASALLEILAVLTGGDGPIDYFLGSISSPVKMSSFLPQRPPPVGLNERMELVFNFLTGGRGSRTVFDMEESPIASLIMTYIYDEDQLEELYTKCNAYFEQKIDAQELLRTYPKGVVADVATAMSKIAASRKDLLQALL